MASPVVLDIETQYYFQEVQNDVRKLKVSLVGLYDYATDSYSSFEEHQVNDLFKKLEHASQIIGFNINRFDLPVLAPYYVGDITQFPTFDILDEVEKILGHRVSLNDLAGATLGTKKSGHGLLAIEYFRKGEMDKLRSYCLDDVKITKELYEYGKKWKKLMYPGQYWAKEFNVNFDMAPLTGSAVSLSLPFD